MAVINFASIFLALAVTSVLGQSDYILAKRVDISPNLIDRASFIGGYALGGGLTTCPTDTISCEKTNGGSNLPGTCCPSGTFCVGLGLGLGVACCPTSANCGVAVQSIPTCANSTWTLYNGVRKYFCCAPGEIGVFPNGGLNDLVGVCVPDDQNVPASNLATAVGGKSTSSAAASATAAASTTANSGGSITSAAASATAAPTKNAGMSNVVPLASVAGGVLGGFMFLAFA